MGVPVGFAVETLGSAVLKVVGDTLLFFRVDFLGLPSSVFCYILVVLGESIPMT